MLDRNPEHKPLDRDLTDFAIIGASHIAEGAQSFPDFSAKIIEEFGTGVGPYLRRIFEKSKYYALAKAALSASDSGEKYREMVRSMDAELQAAKRERDRLIEEWEALIEREKSKRENRQAPE